MFRRCKFTRGENKARAARGERTYDSHPVIAEKYSRMPNMSQYHRRGGRYGRKSQTYPPRAGTICIDNLRSKAPIVRINRRVPLRTPQSPIDVPRPQTPVPRLHRPACSTNCSPHHPPAITHNARPTPPLSHPTLVQTPTPNGPRHEILGQYGAKLLGLFFV